MIFFLLFAAKLGGEGVIVAWSVSEVFFFLACLRRKEQEKKESLAPRVQLLQMTLTPICLFFKKIGMISFLKK